MKKFAPLFLATASLATIFFASCAKKSDAIKVGEYASLTGKEASFGQQSHKGLKLAIE